MIRLSELHSYSLISCENSRNFQFYVIFLQSLRDIRTTRHGSFSLWFQQIWNSFLSNKINDAKYSQHLPDFSTYSLHSSIRDTRDPQHTEVFSISWRSNFSNSTFLTVQITKPQYKNSNFEVILKEIFQKVSYARWKITKPQLSL